MSQVDCSRVAWSEGMLIEAQHFQQMQRHLEHAVSLRLAQTGNHGWGFSQLALDEESLAIDKFGLRRARGVFPDGTAFALPDGDPLPDYLDTQGVQPGEVVCLAVAGAHLGSAEVGFGERSALATRYVASLIDVPDANVGDGVVEPARSIPLQAGRLNVRLCRESQLRSDDTHLRVARIQARHGPRSLTLDARFIPPLLDARAHPALLALTAELRGVLQMRLSKGGGPRILSAGSGVAELIEILMVQALSEYRLRLQHLEAFDPLPPALLFHEMTGLLGRLSVVPSVEDEIDQATWRYRHDDLQGSFDGLARALRRALALVIETPLVHLPFEDGGDGFHRCVIDPQWKLQKMVFAFSADMPSEQLRTLLPQQLKLGPVEKIARLVDLQLPGARLRPLPVTPRHVPYYAQSVYFDVEAADPYWPETMRGAAMALRVVGDFPGLRFEAWGLREGKVA